MVPASSRFLYESWALKILAWTPSRNSKGIRLDVHRMSFHPFASFLVRPLPFSYDRPFSLRCFQRVDPSSELHKRLVLASFVFRRPCSFHSRRLSISSCCVL